MIASASSQSSGLSTDTSSSSPSISTFSANSIVLTRHADSESELNYDQLNPQKPSLNLNPSPKPPISYLTPHDSSFNFNNTSVNLNQDSTNEEQIKQISSQLRLKIEALIKVYLKGASRQSLDRPGSWSGGSNESFVDVSSSSVTYNNEIFISNLFKILFNLNLKGKLKAEIQLKM